MHPDLIATRQAIREGRRTSPEVAQECLAIATSAACESVFLQLTPDSLRSCAAQAGIHNSPLAGLPVSIKDLFDVQGQVSAAGSTVLAQAPAAQQDATAVARLRQAGAGLMGRTNMVEFAFSGVGNNPHHGTPKAWDGLSRQQAGSNPDGHVPGGSSSGAAVSVATGAAFIGLGSDTGGSIRIPAALNGIVGFKNTARRVPTQGALPLSTSLDTVCAMTRSVRDSVLVHEILSARTVPITHRPLRGYRLAIASRLMQDDMDSSVAKAFDRTLNTLRQAGAQIDELPMPELDELAPMMATGGFSPAEGYTWHRHLLESSADRYDPRVLARILRGANMLAHEYMDLLQARSQWIARMQSKLMPYDAVLSPTTPITAPLRSAVAPGPERDAEFFRVNALLLRNTSAVNTLDGCAISLPCHQPGELPVGLMAWHGPMRDDTILQLALVLEETLQRKH
jgi:amidase/aspartyl-tRNA(Asn)/glutamyl-tRNA(Gln) amidotransferase subunit A